MIFQFTYILPSDDAVPAVIETAGANEGAAQAFALALIFARNPGVRHLRIIRSVRLPD